MYIFICSLFPIKSNDLIFGCFASIYPVILLLLSNILLKNTLIFPYLLFRFFLIDNILTLMT